MSFYEEVCEYDRRVEKINKECGPYVGSCAVEADGRRFKRRNEILDIEIEREDTIAKMDDGELLLLINHPDPKVITQLKKRLCGETDW